MPPRSNERARILQSSPHPLLSPFSQMDGAHSPIWAQRSNSGVSFRANDAIFSSIYQKYVSQDGQVHVSQDSQQSKPSSCPLLGKSQVLSFFGQYLKTISWSSIANRSSPFVKLEQIIRQTESHQREKNLCVLSKFSKLRQWKLLLNHKKKNDVKSMDGVSMLDSLSVLVALSNLSAF